MRSANLKWKPHPVDIAMKAWGFAVSNYFAIWRVAGIFILFMAAIMVLMAYEEITADPDVGSSCLTCAVAVPLGLLL